MILNNKLIPIATLFTVTLTTQPLIAQSVEAFSTQGALFSPVNGNYQQETPISKVEAEYIKALREVDLHLESVDGKLTFPEQTTLNLFSGEAFSFKVKRRELSSTNNVEIIYGYVFDSSFDHINNYSNVIFTINHDTGKLSGLIETEYDSYLVQPSENGRYNIIKQRIPEILDQHVLPKQGQEIAKLYTNHQTVKGETDKKGNIIIDVYLGFSEQAAKKVGDPKAEAEMYVASVNNGLKNSGVNNIKLRLVGTGITSHNLGIISKVLGQVEQPFQGDDSTKTSKKQPILAIY